MLFSEEIIAWSSRRVNLGYYSNCYTGLDTHRINLYHIDAVRSTLPAAQTPGAETPNVPTR